MADQSIELMAYDPTWQARFAEQQARLATVLAPWLGGEIEHIGSTSVPGLRSKPIVDILAPVRSLTASRSATPFGKGWLVVLAGRSQSGLSPLVPATKPCGAHSSPADYPAGSSEFSSTDRISGCVAA
jgi:GrpB-like predicted nucleotidyltransferase (UPF0157 family)